MLTENDVIDAVCRTLLERGWETTSTATTRQRGDDVVAKKGRVTMLVEAKGATSSKSNTARFGVEFSPGQVRTHVAVAVLRALRVWSARGTPDFPRTIRLRNGELRVRDDWYQAWLCDLELS